MGAEVPIPEDIKFTMKVQELALAGVAQLVGHCPMDQKLQVRFLVRAGTWIGGSVPGWDAGVYTRGGQLMFLTSMFLSLSPSLPFPSLSKINKHVLGLKKKKGIKTVWEQSRLTLEQIKGHQEGRKDC